MAPDTGNTTLNTNTPETEPQHKSWWPLWLLGSLILLFLLVIIILRSLCTDAWYINLLKLNDNLCNGQSSLQQNLNLKDGSIRGPEIAEGAITLDNLSPSLQVSINNINNQLANAVPGPQGPSGSSGFNGIAGANGANGPAGPIGPAGPTDPCVVNGTYFCQNGNSYGTLAVLGTNDAQDLQVKTAGARTATFDVNGNFEMNRADDIINGVPTSSTFDATSVSNIVGSTCLLDPCAGGTSYVNSSANIGWGAGGTVVNSSANLGTLHNTQDVFLSIGLIQNTTNGYGLIGRTSNVSNSSDLLGGFANVTNSYGLLGYNDRPGFGPNNAIDNSRDSLITQSSGGNTATNVNSSILYTTYNNTATDVTQSILLSGNSGTFQDIQYSYANGYLNDLTNIDFSTIIGAGNTISDTNNSFISTTNGTHTGLDNVILWGDSTNTVDNVSYSMIFGTGNTVSSSNSVTLGTDNTNSGQYAVVFGNDNIASGLNSTAFGWETTASGLRSTAFGNRAVASGTDSVAFGSQADTVGPVASGQASTAFGTATLASGIESTAFGYVTTASGQRSTAFGTTTLSGGYNSTAFGSGTVASGDYSTAFGANTDATADRSTAFGNGTLASGQYSTAFGNSSIASGESSIAAGLLTTASGSSSVAVGAYATASGISSFAFGGGNCIPIPNPLGRFNNLSSAGASVAFGCSQSTGDNSFSSGFQNQATSNGSIAIGQHNTSTGITSLAIGTSNTASGNYSSAFGLNSSSAAENSTAFGRDMNVGALASNSFGVALDSAGYTLTDANTMAIMGGEVGIGTVTPGYKLHVYDTTTDTTAAFTGLTQTCEVDTSGPGGWNCTSDERLKQNIMSMEGSLDKLLQLQGVTYNFKSNPDGEAIAGFVAQEVQKILPSLVGQSADGYLNLNKEGMIPYIVEAIKEQNGNIENINKQLAGSGLQIENLTKEMKALADRLDQAETDIKDLKDRVNKLESQKPPTTPTPTQPTE